MRRQVVVTSTVCTVVIPLNLCSSNGELDGLVAGVASVEDINLLAAVKRVVLGRAGVELGGAVGRERHDGAVAVEAPASAVALKRRSGVVQNLELAGLDVGEQLTGLLTFGEDVNHGVSNRVGIEVGEALGETVDHVVASDLERLHSDDPRAGEHAESILRGIRVVWGFFADNGGGQSGGGNSEESEGVDHCCNVVVVFVVTW